MQFVRFSVGLILLVSLWGCTNATPEVTLFSRSKPKTEAGSLRETLVGVQSATGTNMKLQARARMTNQYVSQSSSGHIVLKSRVR